MGRTVWRFAAGTFSKVRCKFLTKHQGEWEKVDPKCLAKPEMFSSGSSSSQMRCWSVLLRTVSQYI